MKKTILSVLMCLALLLASVQASVVQAQAPSPEEKLVEQVPEIVRARPHLEPPVIYPDDLPDGWHDPHFEEYEEREYIPPTEESLKLTQEQVQAFDCGTVTDVPRVECEALVALYESTNGAGWTDNTNWLQTTTVCNWFGITVIAGYVERVDLEENNLTGTIPAELANLANLEYLWLSNNQLTGTIPAELGNLTYLKYLYLDSNQLTGTIPAELANLANLEDLWLSNNQLTGTIPAELGNLTNLWYLYLDSNQLTGTIPAELANLANLEYLWLSNNQLTGTIPAELANLANLEYLWLSNNQLTGTIPVALSNLTNLEYLWLSNNQLTGMVHAELGNLSNLVSLYLGWNQLTGTIPAELGNLTNLEYLVLCSNQLTGTIPVALSNLTNLEFLGLFSNQLTGTIPTWLGNLSNLWYLGLFSNQLTGTIPAELGNLTNLEYLWLDNNQLTGTIPSELGNLTELIHLDLSRNLLEGDVPASFTNLVNLCVDGQPEERCYNYFNTDLGYNLLNVPQPNPPSDFLYQKDPDWDKTQGVKGIFPGTTGGTLVSNDGRTTVAVPPGAVDGELTLILKPTPPFSGFTPPYISAGNNFELLAFDANGEVSQFNQALTFTLKYNDSDIGLMPEENLALHYYNVTTEQWRDAISTCSSGSYTRNPEQNQFSLPVCHLTNFAVVGEGFMNYFPTLLK